MKENEKDILNKINEQCNLNLIWDNYKYNKFDAEDKHYIVEIKDRHKFYSNTMIEFSKYSYNLVYSQIKNKQFIYAVRMDSKIYIFNISTSDSAYGWEWKSIEATSNFENRQKVKKFVGYLDIDDSKRILIG